MLEDASIMVTGGTGSFGKAFIGAVLQRHPKVRRLVVYSRDELKQYEMSQVLSELKYPQMRYFIGDVRDKERLARAMEDIDIVVHAAALKHIPACEYNPFEAIKTNVLGAQNVIEAAMAQGVRRVVALSTDKAAAPINLYGATKLASDKLFVAANYSKGSRDLRLSVVRYGNVLGSRGSVVPFFLSRRHAGVLPITDERMTRFNITLVEGVDLVLDALDSMWGGEIFVPKIPSYRITDVAEALSPGCKLEVIGIRPGEKLHEEMITETDSLSTVEFADRYVILPAIPVWDVAEFIEAHDAKKCDPDFCYSSGTNTDWLTVEQIRELTRKYVDPSFEV